MFWNQVPQLPRCLEHMFPQTPRTPPTKYVSPWSEVPKPQRNPTKYVSPWSEVPKPQRHLEKQKICFPFLQGSFKSLHMQNLIAYLEFETLKLQWFDIWLKHGPVANLSRLDGPVAHEVHLTTRCGSSSISDWEWLNL